MLGTLLITNGCQKQKSAIPLLKIEKVQHEKSILTSELVDSIHFFPLETNDSCLIGSDYEVKIQDAIIGINNFSGNKSFVLYDFLGKHYRNIGSQGNGPLELTYFHDFVMSEDEIEIVDLNAKKHLIYDFDGNIIKSDYRKYSALALERDNFGNYWYYKGWGNSDSNYQLMKTSADGTNREDFYKLKSSAIPFDMNPFTKIDSNLYVFLPLQNSLFEIKDGEIEEKYRIDFDHDIPEGFHHGDFMLAFDKMNRTGFFLINRYFEKGKYVYINVKCQDNREVQNIHVLYNKEKDMQSVFMAKDGDPEFNLGKALTINENNELVFLVNAYAFNDLGLSEMKRNILDNPVLVFLKLKQ